MKYRSCPCLDGQTVKLSVSAVFHVWLQTTRLSFEWKWLAKQRGQLLTKRSPKSSLRSWVHRMWSASWKPVLVSEAWRELWWCLWPSPGSQWPPHITYQCSRCLWRYYWQFLPVAVRLITLYFCHSSVTLMINVESYVTQPDRRVN